MVFCCVPPVTLSLQSSLKLNTISALAKSDIALVDFLMCVLRWQQGQPLWATHSSWRLGRGMALVWQHSCYTLLRVIHVIYSRSTQKSIPVSDNAKSESPLHVFEWYVEVATNITIVVHIHSWRLSLSNSMAMIRQHSLALNTLSFAIHVSVIQKHPAIDHSFIRSSQSISAPLLCWLHLMVC